MLTPLYDRVVIKHQEENTTSAGGVVIPNSAKEKPVKGEVIAVCNGKLLNNGSVRALDLRVGDRVLFAKYSGTQLNADGEEYLVMREGDVLGVIDD